MFVGKYYNSIDSKSRLTIPAKFREQLEGECVVAMSEDHCLTIYPVSEWEAFMNELEKLPRSNKKARTFKRFMQASASGCDIDKQGRVTISPEHKKFANIDKELVTIGSNKYIEVWSKESWDEQFDLYMDSEEFDISKLAEELEVYGF